MASAGFGPVFKSILKETAKKLSNKGSGEQFLNQLKNTQGLKQQELKWSGLDDFLKNKKSVTKQEIQEYLNKNSLDVSEVQLPRTTKEAEALELLQIKVQGDYDRLYGRLSKLPENQGRMVDPFRFKLTNTLEDGKRINEDVTMDTLDNIFIGQRLTTYIPFSKDLPKTTNYFNKKKLIDDFGKEGDPNTLEFYLLEDSVSGRITAHSRKNYKDVIGQEDLMSGGKYEFSYKTEMSIDEAEKYAIQKTRDRIDRALKSVSGETKFGGVGYVEAGGKDYKEIIFKLKGDKGYPIEYENLIKGKQKTSFPYTSPKVHFGTKNEFAHVRFKTRELNGQKVLTVEEMQSDIVQDMKKAYSGQVTDFPFKNNWYELVTKRLIRYAADNNFDAVAIPKANIIASRYKQKIVKTAEGKITGTGKGKSDLYDKAIPSFLKKYGKKWNAEVYEDKIDLGLAYGSEGTGEMPVTIIKLTDEMKKSVQQDGQALFSIFGLGAGAKIASDSMQNNSISKQTNN